MEPHSWKFFVDVGGTFTDVVAVRSDGRLATLKLLSSGVVRGRAAPGSSGWVIVDPSRVNEPAGLWVGYTVALLGAGGGSDTARVVGFDPNRGSLTLDKALPVADGVAYELSSGEEAPIVAIRYLLGLGLSDRIGPIEVRLGTTRATNALLERKGARVAFVTTKGFADVLKIGYQDRPSLFDLHIRKRDELADRVVEIDERLAADGSVIRTPDAAAVREALAPLRADGIESLAICLLHSYVNPAHEELVASVARTLGFTHVSVSSRVARMQRIVPRGDTTVVDAYLAPVLTDYVASLRRSLPEARLQLMTSSGGLVDAEHVSGHATVLSGPAGGVVGCARVSRRAGFDRAIGFDMGGTSTDVCRIEAPPAEFEYQHEAVKAGVRIMAPMLAVETVAAGGGSICAFDGQKLTVGPQSAGADPGPACYGRGGPLTVTDMNLLLGRIVPEHFPFRLDRDAVEGKAANLCARINRATGAELDTIRLAEGFIAIANANMAAAIKRISLARGYDVRDYVLTTFGGAGGQHACAVARLLGMTRILCNPYAGVLSALGIGLADVKRIAQRSVVRPLDAAAPAALEPVFDELASAARELLYADGVGPGRDVVARRTVDLCYAGQASTISVSADPWDAARGRFEGLHEQLYGYRHTGRDVEVRALRVELAAVGETLDIAPPRSNHPSATDRETALMVVDGGARSVPLRVRDDVRPGDRLQGPAILIEDTSTVIVDIGWEAVVRETGDIVLSDLSGAERHARVSADVDPVQLELFNNQFAAVAEQMGTTLRRTALSVNVKERLDFSCAVFAPDGQLVVNAPHIPVHLGGMSDCVKALMEDVGGLAAGDVYITNDPYRGGSHLNDVTVITPVLDGDGRRLLFFVASRAHHAEIGGTRPGSMPPDSTCLAEEGVLIRAFRWIEDGRPRSDQLRALLTAPPYPSRSPDENLADIAAQVAANQTGVHALSSMMERYGIEVVHAYMGHIRAAAERKMRAAIAKLPDGVRSFADSMDDGTPIRLRVTIDGDRAILDFTGTGPVMRGNLNANRSIVTSAILYCFRCLIEEDIPLNAGVLAPIEVVLPECFLNPPRRESASECAAVVGGNVETSQRIVDCIFGALGTVAASQGTMNNLLMGNERFGYYETICGGAGAGPGFDGADAVHTNMTNTRLTDPEVLESRVPVRLIRFAIRGGSGGTGRFRGGCGVVRELEFLEPLEVSVLSQRRTTVPNGVGGGGPGARGWNLLRRRGSERTEVLSPIASVSVAAGDRLTIETPGGGGWG